MELSFENGRFVSSSGKLNYQEIIDDFPNAKIIRIITYNISKNLKYDKLLELLENVDADVRIITNIPSRMDHYYSSDAGQRKRIAARNNINIYVSKLNPENYNGKFNWFFCSKNHAKVIGTENKVYIGSANYSNESAGNIESGVIIEDKEFIKRLYDEFFTYIEKYSISYYDESFSAFKIYILSLHAKFQQHLSTIIKGAYYQGKNISLSDPIYIDVSELDDFYRDLEELESFCSFADDTYEDLDDDYNDDLDALKERFNCLSIDWLKDIISEDGLLYDLVTYDQNETALRYLQDNFSSEAYDEYLNEYTEKSVNMAAEEYFLRYDAFEVESEDFVTEIERIICALYDAERFASKWAPRKINPKVDNTGL